MRSRLLAARMALVLALALGAMAYGVGGAAPSPYSLAKFYLGFAAEGLEKQDSGAWEKRYRVCTTLPAVADSDYIYGYMVDHCVDNEPDFVVKRYLIFNRAVDTIEAEVSSVLGNEIVAWRAPNKWGIQAHDLPIGVAPTPEDKFVYYCGLWKTKESRKPICAEGQIMGEADEYLSSVGGYYVGDLVFAGPVFWGFSGAPIFVVRDGRYELVALINAFSIFSNISFGLTIPSAGANLKGLWEGQAPRPPTKPMVISRPSGYDAWPDEYKHFWDSAYEADVPYSVEYQDGQYSLHIVHAENMAIFRFEDVFAVLMALVNKKIALSGTLQGVQWEEFAIAPISLKPIEDQTQGSLGVGIDIPLKIEINIPIDESTKRVMHDSFVALGNLAESLNFYARAQLIILLAFAIANAIVLGILLVTDSRVRRAATRASAPFKRMGKMIAKRLGKR